MRVCVLGTSFPRYAVGDGACGNFIHDITQAISGDVDVRVTVPHDFGARTRERFGRVEVRRFRYFLPARLQRVAYGEKGIVENVKASWLARLQVPLFLASFVIGALRAARGCDLVHGNWILGGAIGLLIRKLLGIPVVLTVHNTNLRHFPSALARHVIGSADAVISPHPELTDLAHSYGRDDVVEIPNMIDFERFRRPVEGDCLRDELGIPQGAPIVLYVARLVDWKDPLTFVKSVPAILAKRPDVRFIVVGAGPLEKNLRSILKEQGVEEAVSMVGNRDDVHRFLHISDVFTALSRVENIWSVSLIEAMTAGLPSVVTRAGTSEKALADGDEALLVDVADPEGLAAACGRLLDDADLRTSIAAGAGRMLARRGFEPVEIVRRTLEVYGRLVPESGRRA